MNGWAGRMTSRLLTGVCASIDKNMDVSWSAVLIGDGNCSVEQKVSDISLISELYWSYCVQISSVLFPSVRHTESEQDLQSEAWTV